MTKFIKRPNSNFTNEQGVSLKEHLKEIIDLRFDAIEAKILEAKRLMEITMDGFPDQFVQKGDTSKLEGKVENLLEFKNQMKGVASQRSMIITLVISILSLLVAGIVGVAGLLRHFQY